MIQAQAQDVDKIQELQRVIDLQQKQLDSQKQVLEDLQQQLHSLAKQVEAKVPKAPQRIVHLPEADRFDSEHPAGSNARMDDSKT
ncbi:MAG TPA: hypothetical protein VMG82_04045 [Candidatus Sulfotelmatobacter sp.]|nr:hypothetical protein [Candidatus Sulfotelmatobacter sp.]